MRCASPGRWRERLLPCATLALVSFFLVTSARAQFRDFTFRLPSGGETTAGVAWTDYDGDGDFDLFATTYGDTAGNENNRLLENRGAAGFAVIEVPELQLPRQLSTSSAWGDFDDDGDADVFIACEADTGVSLFRNDGAASFVDVTPPVLRSRSGCYSSVWVDTDLDGDLDLGVASRDGAKLYRNDGGGRFADITRPPLDVPAWCMEWTDFDRDGDPDAFLGTVQSQSGGELILARNDGDNRFFDIARGTLGGGQDGAFSGSFADYDLDGDADLYVTYFVDPGRLFRNDGPQGFSDVTPAILNGSGSAYTSMWVDYDNDGDPDLLRCGQLAGTSSLYRNDGVGFGDVSSALLGARQSSNWSGAWGDWDGDGRQDLYLGQAGSASDVLLRNETSVASTWLAVELEGVLSNRQGMGARIEVSTPGRTQVREISGGGDGWCSQAPPIAWFGLGRQTLADVTVFWPSGQRRVLAGVAANQRIVVREPGLAPIDSSFIA
ncbi:MAG TPA: CRTAC1 family protein, partial [bacterium]|nr:CRTAC1 family protein [bacterium]